MKRSLLISAGLALTVIFGSSILIAQKAQQAEARWHAEMQTQGLHIDMDSALQWQLWPLGLKARKLTLKTGSGDILISSPVTLFRLGPADIFSAKCGALHFQDATFFYQRHADGSSNWDALLNSRQPSLLRSLVLENATLEIRGPDSASALSMSIPQLQWENGGNAGHPLQADFLLSTLDESQHNLLLEGSLQTVAQAQEAGAWLLKNSSLTTTVASTRLPGTLFFQSSGDIRLQAHELRSDSLKIASSFKAPGLTQDLIAELSTALQLDWQAGTLQLSPSSVVAGGTAWQLQGDMQADWKQQTLTADQLGLSRKTADQPTAQRMAISGLTLSTKSEGELHLLQLSGKIGAGSFDIPLKARLAVDSADISASFTASNMDLKDFRDWMNDPEASGQFFLSGQAELSGHSLGELKQQASGQLSLKLKDAQISRIKVMPALRERLQGYASLLPALAEDGDKKNDSAIRELQMQISLKNGAITTEKLRADFALAQLDANGSYDSRNGLMNYRGKLALDRRLFTQGKGMELPIVCQGNLHEEQVDFIDGLQSDCKVAEEAKQDLLARALINRFRN